MQTRARRWRIVQTHRNVHSCAVRIDQRQVNAALVRSADLNSLPISIHRCSVAFLVWSRNKPKSKKKKTKKKTTEIETGSRVLKKTAQNMNKKTPIMKIKLIWKEVEWLRVQVGLVWEIGRHVFLRLRTCTRDLVGEVLVGGGWGGSTTSLQVEVVGSSTLSREGGGGGKAGRWCSVWEPWSIFRNHVTWNYSQELGTCQSYWLDLLS